MATPVGDSYSCGPDGVIAAGRSFLPSWVPSLGQLKSVHLNSLSSINPCPENNCWYSEASKQNGPWCNWAGGVFASDFSDYGAMVYFGGGHGGYDGTEYYIFDLGTRQWSRTGEIPPNGYFDYMDTEWCDYLQNGSYIIPSQHTYSHAVYLSAAQAGNAKGSFLLTYQVFGGGPGEGPAAGRQQPHAIDLSTGVSSRYTSNTGSPYLASGPYGGSFIDTNRNVVWAMPGHGTNANAKIDLNNPTKSVESVTSFYSPGYYFAPVFIKEKDMLIAAWCGYGSTDIALAGYDLSSGTPVGFEIIQGSTRTAPHGPGFGMDYCPHTGKFYAYEGFGSTTVHVLTPPFDWKTGTWTWSSETMSGETPVFVGDLFGGSAQGGQVLTKWKYNQKLRSFMWSQGTVSRQSTDGVTRDGAFQLYRPLGT